jgi:hypothetical protein
VEGGVTDATGKVLSDYTVVILPQDAPRNGVMPFQLRIARGDQQGRFRTDRLQPGNYVAAVVADLDTETMYEPDTLDALRRAGKPFRILDAENVTLALTLDSRPAAVP